MAGLSASLINNFQALNANAQALDVTGKNLANINNTGYARQKVILGTLGTINTPEGVQSMGVMALGLEQARDILLDRQVQRDVSKTASLTARQSGLEAAQSALGQQIDRTNDTGSVGSVSGSTGTGINENLSTFFAGFESLSVSPSDPGEQQLLLQKSAILVDKINGADSNLAQVQSDLTDQVTSDVTKANDLLTAIANLNHDIGAAENVKPDSAVDLRDQRQQKIEDLSAYMDFTVANIVGGHGQVSLTSSNGVNLTNATATNLIAFDGTNFTAGTAAAPLVLTGGSLQSCIDVRDGTVEDTRTQLKALADQLTTSVNKAYNPANTAGMNFFSAVPASGLIQLEATTATIRTTTTGTSGGNELAVNVAALASQIFSTGSGDKIDGTFSSHFSGVVANLGLDLSNTNTRLDDQKLTETNTRANRESVSGVSQDEELANMLQYQRSYQACARFTNVIDSLLDIVVNKLGSF